MRLRATANGACERTPSHLPQAPKVTRNEVAPPPPCRTDVSLRRLEWGTDR
jgi:hypothetical protein